MTVTQVCVFVNLRRETAVHLQALSLNLALTLKFLTLMSLSLVPKPKTTRSRTQDTSGLSRQCSATEPRQPANHQPSQSSICTAQVVLNASVTHPATTQYVLSQNSVRAALATLATFQFIALSLCSYVNSLMYFQGFCLQLKLSRVCPSYKMPENHTWYTYLL